MHPFPTIPLFLIPLYNSLTIPISLFLCFLANWAVDYAHCASLQAQAPAPAPSVNCPVLILSMADCFSFASNGSTATKPEGTCCNGLRTVLKADAACLCEAFNGSALVGVVLNVTKAMTLPAACKVSAPSATNCALSTTPASAPALPSGSSPAPISPGADGPGGASEQVPAPSPGSSESSVISISFGSLLVGLLVASISNF